MMNKVNLQISLLFSPCLLPVFSDVFINGSAIKFSSARDFAVCAATAIQGIAVLLTGLRASKSPASSDGFYKPREDLIQQKSTHSSGRLYPGSNHLLFNCLHCRTISAESGSRRLDDRWSADICSKRWRAMVLPDFSVNEVNPPHLVDGKFGPISGRCGRLLAECRNPGAPCLN